MDPCKVSEAEFEEFMEIPNAEIMGKLDGGDLMFSSFVDKYTQYLPLRR